MLLGLLVGTARGNQWTEINAPWRKEHDPLGVVLVTGGVVRFGGVTLSGVRSENQDFR